MDRPRAVGVDLGQPVELDRRHGREPFSVATSVRRTLRNPLNSRRTWGGCGLPGEPAQSAPVRRRASRIPRDAPRSRLRSSSSPRSSAPRSCSRSTSASPTRPRLAQRPLGRSRQLPARSCTTRSSATRSGTRSSSRRSRRPSSSSAPACSRTRSCTVPRPLAPSLLHPAPVGGADRADGDRLPLVLRPAGVHLQLVPVQLHLVDPHHLPNWLGTPKAAMSSIITVQAWRTIPFATVIFIAGSRRSRRRSTTRGDRRRDRPEEVLVRLAAAAAADRPRRDPLRDHLHGDRHDRAVHPHERRPVQLDAGPHTYAFQTGINAGNIGEGAAIALFMLPRARGRRDRDARLRATGGGHVTSGGGTRLFSYGITVPFVIVLAFPFFWMAVTSLKPEAQVYDPTKVWASTRRSPTTATSSTTRTTCAGCATRASSD